MNLESVAKGNTQKGVNRAVLQFLLEKSQKKNLKSLLDAPCGQGEFLKACGDVLPSMTLEGHDLFAEALPEVSRFIQKDDLKGLFQKLNGKKFDVVTSISGVMVFDHVSEYIQGAAQALNPQGFLILTNDNILTVRDRLNFLIFGHLKRFPLLYSPEEGNWNVLLIQGLWKLLKQNQFDIVKVEYTSLYGEDFIFLPIALLLYPFLWLQVMFGKRKMDKDSRKKLFPFKSLLARHYVIYAQKR